MNSIYRLWPIIFAGLVMVGCQSETTTKPTEKPATQSLSKNASTIAPGYRGIAVDVEQVATETIEQWKSKDWQQVVLMVDDETNSERIVQACQLIQSAQLPVEYFWEVARCPQLADAHPEWMASLQGHDEWRRLFPNFPAAKSNEVVKTYPWVPICYRESFTAQLDRITERLKTLPRPQRVWLHDLQAAPSACGCGHPLCRWTGDYGPIHTAEPLGDSAAADFIHKLNERFPDVEFVPIWTTECEEEDEHEACGGVGCFEGICWKAWTRQLAAIEKVSPVLGVSAFYKAYDRDLPRYGTSAAWIKSAVSFFESVPTQKNTAPVKPERLVVVLQGWNVSDQEIAAQVSFGLNSQTRGLLLVQPQVDQSWEPRIYQSPK